MIKRIRFDAEALQSLGLHTQELRDLGPRVVLAGPNGGGKTRHLQLIQAAVHRHHKALHGLESLDRLALQMRATDPGNDAHREYLELREQHLRIAREIEATPPEAHLYVAPLRYEPDPDPFPLGEMIKLDGFDHYIQKIEPSSRGALASGLQAYLERTARALWDGTHPRAGNFPAVVAEHDLARRFNEILRELLDTAIEPEVVGSSRVIPRLFGRPFQPEELSMGQRVLICWAILLLRQADHYKGKIVLVDEPEVYLHPDACVRAIGSLEKLVGPDGQIWIATHSLPLIAWAGAGSLYFVQDGTATFAGAAPSHVWRTLLGGEPVRDALLSFLDGDAAAAATRFASECLLPPEAMPARPGDPQPGQLLPLIADLLRRGGPARILELGAGRGRLVAALTDRLRAPSEPRLDPARLTYVAYQDARFADPDHRTSCEAHLSDLGALGATTRYSTSLAELQARANDRADLVVLANTLHEIPVEDWLDLFDQIRQASQPDATLLVIEDQEPRIGELPHPRGFLILERDEWRALIDAEINERVTPHNGRRLTAFALPVARLVHARTNLGRALQLVINRTTAEIRHLRDQPPTADPHRAGRRHAFLAMLHLNATFAQRIYPP